MKGSFKGPRGFPLRAPLRDLEGPFTGAFKGPTVGWFPLREPFKGSIGLPLREPLIRGHAEQGAFGDPTIWWFTFAAGKPQCKAGLYLSSETGRDRKDKFNSLAKKARELSGLTGTNADHGGSPEILGNPMPWNSMVATLRKFGPNSAGWVCKGDRMLSSCSSTA